LIAVELMPRNELRAGSIPDKPPAHVQAIANFLPNGGSAGSFGPAQGDDRPSGTI
jgi:hypothetical protein